MHDGRTGCGRGALLGVWMLAMATSCAPLDPAPEDLDGLVQYLWSHHGDGEDAELALAVGNLHGALGGEAPDEALEGSLSDLPRAELDALGMRADADASAPAGLYRIAALPCALGQIEDILTDPDQLALYPDEYLGYSRAFEDDPGAFAAGERALLRWWEQVDDSLAGADYRREVDAALRRVPAGAAGDGWPDELLAVRAWQPAPAVFDADTEYYWDQDYQLDLYYAPTAQTVIHLTALWRHVGMGLIDSDNEWMQTMILKARENRDERTAELCQGSR